jgi:uncharacterized protein (DUF885 family)
MAHPIFDFGDRLTDEYGATYPVSATFHGVSGFDDRLDDYSPDGVGEAIERHRRWLAEMAALPPVAGYFEALASRTIREWLENELEALEAGEPYRDLNNIDCPAQDLVMVFEVMDQDSSDGWAQINERLRLLGGAIDGYRATLDRGRSRGLVAAKRQVAAVIRQLGEYSESALADLPASFEKAGAPGGPAARRDLESGITEARTSFGLLAGYLSDEYMADAADTDPVGAERHQAAARRFLGMTLDPAETYEWGWTEVARLREEMTAAAAAVKPGASIPEAMAYLAADPERASRDRDDFVKLLTDLQLKALRDLDGTAFRIPAQARDITVNISPPGSTLGAQYIGPAEDFSRPGTVWFGLDDTEHQIPVHNHISTNYHEGFPGHHLQVVFQMSNAKNLSRFHRTFVWYPGSGEGWALYSERLMLELGYFERPEYVLNTHAESMLRACRVVVDIGSHMGYTTPENQPFHPGEPWSFETAVEMLMEYALQMQSYAESEVTRYLGWPGQALAYKVGERQILDMREQLRERDGDSFDLIDFHDKVLTPGAIGLDHLRDLVVG